MAHKRAQRKETEEMNEGEGMRAAAASLVVAGAVGTALGYLFGTEGGASMRRSIAKRMDSMKKSYERAGGASRASNGRFKRAGATA